MKHRSFLKVGVFAVLLACAPMSGCGKGAFQFVHDLQLRAFLQADGTYLEMRALLDTGSLDFGATVPIYDPRNPGTVYGSITLRPDIGGSGSELILLVNVTTARLIEAVDGDTLPNGAPIPLTTGGVPVIGMRIGQNSKAFLALGPGVMMAGVALVVKEFDAIAGKVPNVNIFPGFSISEKISGVAGLFTGNVPSSSGIGLFVDVHSVIDSNGQVVVVDNPMVSTLNFDEKRGTAAQEKTVQKELQKLNKRAARSAVRMSVI